MADNFEVWSDPREASWSTNTTHYQHEQIATHPSYRPWHNQAMSTPQTPYQPNISLDKQIPPNVNPFSSNSYSWHGHSNSLDAEVSYYNNFSGLAPSSQWYDDNRCSSTDTSLSSSSASTVFSQGSVDTEFSEDCELIGQKRKKQSQEKNLSKKAKKETIAPTYRRWPKPPYSYCGMIAVALQRAPRHELTLQGIHASLMEFFPFFRGSYMGWRCSVRHTLSHCSCFVKLPTETPQRASLWTVDWSKLSPVVFDRQNSKFERADNYKDTIHEHLGMEPYHNETYAQNDSPVRKGIKKTANQPKRKKGKSKIPDISDTHSFRVKLPGVAKCENEKNSPTQFRPRDSSLTHVQPKSADDKFLYEKTSPATASFSGSYNPFYDSFLDVIMASRRSSLDAAQHLQSLSAPHTQPPLTPIYSVLPPLSRDSDVYSPLPPCENLSTKMSGELVNASGDHLDQDYITNDQCETLKPSYLDLDNIDTTRGRSFSESSAAADAEVTVVVEEEIHVYTNM